MSSEKEIVACIMAGATHGSDVRISAVSEFPLGSTELQPRELSRDDISSDHLSSSGLGPGGYTWLFSMGVHTSISDCEAWNVFEHG
jgi:hypothetical protein